MKNFRFSPALSLFDLKLYREAAQANLGWGFAYLAYWSGIIAFLGLLVYSFLLMPSTNRFFDWFEKDLPALAYNAETGFIMNEPSPYVMESPEYGRLITLDMESQGPSEEQISTTPIFVTAKKIYYEKPAGGIGFFDVNRPGASNGKTVLINDFFKKLRGVVAVGMGFAIVFSFFVGSFIIQVLSGLFFSLIGLWINSRRTRKLEYSQVLNVTFFASTAMILLDLFKLSPQGNSFPDGVWYFMSFAVMVFYLFLGIKLAEEK